MNDLRIVFMGTPDFAAGILDTIIKHNYKVVGVVTAPDRPAGRGQKVRHSAVKEYALDKDLPILQPTHLKSEEFLHELDTLQANLFVVVAFRMLPEVVWKKPLHGTFNLHASLLPEYRGAAPINWALINGETKTGVSTFFIDEKIDTGAVILKNETPIAADENAGQLHDRLMVLGGTTVVETLELIAHENVLLQQQPEEDTKPAPKLNKENTKIDWSRNGIEIFNHIRGLSPYPTAWFEMRDGEQSWNVKVYEATFEPLPHDSEIGTVLTTKKELKIAVRDGFIGLSLLQFPGKKQMTTANLLNGMQFSINAKAL